MKIEVKREPIIITIEETTFKLSEEDATTLLYALNNLLKIFNYPYTYSISGTTGNFILPPGSSCTDYINSKNITLTR